MDAEPAPGLPQMQDLWQQTLGWQPSAAQQAQLQRLYALILQGNRQQNLTRITEPAEFWEKHLWDSLAGVPDWFSVPETLEPSYRAIDIGTGAGFPGIPLAIVRPDWAVTLLDATRKKIAFLDTLVAELELTNARTWCDRAEQVGQHRQHRESYDLAVIRAVAPAPVCAEYALPLLKLGGMAVLYRGQWTAEEAEALQSAIAQLGGAIASVRSFTTPLSHSVRHCIDLQKVAPTPAEFPRPVGVPSQRAL